MPSRIDPSHLTPDILLRAYAIGLFPMAEKASDEHLFWVDPVQRGIFPLDNMIVSKSLAQLVRSDRFEIRVNHDFTGVIGACAGHGINRPATWINQRIRHLFLTLHQMGHVHTVETWRNGRLVGGLYGLAQGGVFCGESMFHKETDASKVALVHLVARLRAGGFGLLDTQFLTPHLASLGAVEIPREEYRRRLAANIEKPGVFASMPGLPGSEALALLKT